MTSAVTDRDQNVQGKAKSPAATPHRRCANSAASQGEADRRSAVDGRREVHGVGRLEDQRREDVSDGVVGDRPAAGSV